MRWIVVTNPLNKQVWLNADHCSRVRRPVSSSEIGNTIIDLADGRIQAVEETLEEVVALLVGD